MSFPHIKLLLNLSHYLLSHISFDSDMARQVLLHRFNLNDRTCRNMFGINNPGSVCLGTSHNHSKMYLSFEKRNFLKLKSIMKTFKFHSKCQALVV